MLFIKENQRSIWPIAMVQKQKKRSHIIVFVRNKRCPNPEDAKRFVVICFNTFTVRVVFIFSLFRK